MNDSTEFRLVAAWRWLYRHKLVLAGATFAGAVGLYAFSFTIQPIYRATAIVRPVEVAPTDMQNSLTGGGATGLVGALLGTTRADQSAVTKAYFTSPSFISSFVTKKNLVPLLFPDKWDDDMKAWKQDAPFLEDAVARFRGRFAVTERSDGLWTLTLDWASAEAAISLTRALISEVNNDRRTIALAEARSNLDYVYKRLGTEPVQEMRQSISRIATLQLEKIMTAQGPSDFALQMVDPPYASRFRVAPNRRLLTAAGGIGGLFIGIFCLLSRRVWEQMKTA